MNYISIKLLLLFFKLRIVTREILIASSWCFPFHEKGIHYCHALGFSLPATHSSPKGQKLCNWSGWHMQLCTFLFSWRRHSPYLSIPQILQHQALPVNGRLSWSNSGVNIRKHLSTDNTPISALSILRLLFWFHMPYSLILFRRWFRTFWSQEGTIYGLPKNPSLAWAPSNSSLYITERLSLER